MPRLPQTQKRAKGLFITAFVIAAGLLLPFLSVAAQVTLSTANVLPGDDGRPASAGRQEEVRVSKGADTYLAVWTDGRTALADNGTNGLNVSTSSTGLGSMLDVYAARLNAAGQVIDTTPVIVNQAQHNQSSPRVGWNGQGWLVSWLTVRPRDQFSLTQDLVAARIAADGHLLDPEPIVIKSDVSLEERPAGVIDDGAGNWVVVWESFLPQEGTSIPRGVFVARVAADGTVLDPGGRVVYNHHSQFMGNPDLARAGDRYLLTFMTFGPPYTVQAVLLDANFNNLRNGPEMLAGNGLNPRVASNGQTWFVAWYDGASGNIQHVGGTLVSRDGDPAGGVNVNPNIGVTPATPQVAWDGTNWHVAYESTYNPATQTYLTNQDVYVTRVSPTGVVLDPNGIAAASAADTEGNPALTPGVGGGALVAWQGNFARDVYAARLSAAGAVTNSAAVALGAPRQSKQRMATNGAGFLTVFRSDQSDRQRILAERLDQNGAALDQEPFLISDQTGADNPSVAWNGSTYLVVWEALNQSGARQTYSRVVPTSGLPLQPTTEPTLVMAGHQPDVAGLNGNFLVTNILQETPQIRSVQTVRVDGAGTPAGTPVKLRRLFDSWPRAVAFGERWLVIWEGHNNHDDSPGTIIGSFVAQDGTAAGAPFVAADLGNDLRPEIAVAADRALVVWETNGNVYSRRLNADGSSPEPAGGAPLADAPGRQALPSVTWDGGQYVATWVDHRNELFPQQPRGDVFGARVAPTNVKIEEFAVADSPLPEDTPFVVAAGGLTVFSYAKFYDGTDAAVPDYTAHRVTLRTTRLPAPESMGVPAAPAALVAEQVNTGPGTGTVKLRWTDASTDESGFKVETASTAAFTQIRLLPAGTTSTEGIGVGANTQNQFRVRAYNAAGDSAYSNVATPPVARIVSPETSVTTTVGRNVRVSVSATDPEGVALVEFYAARDHLNGSTSDPAVLIGVATAPGEGGLYHFDWVLPPAGYYHVNARVTDAAASSTTTYSSTVFVTQPPTSLITSPAGGAIFKQPAPVTLTATAQTNNNRTDEFIERVDFYNGTRWIGRGAHAEWQAPWSFAWTGAPTGTHTITAHATSSWGETAVSPPVVVVVNPETEPEPELNIKPVVVLTSPLTLANFAAGATVPAAATAIDEDGQIARVEFRAGGRTVEVDTAAPYAADLNLPGGTHEITAVAFDNRGGSASSLPARITIDRTAGPQLTSTQSDGRSQFGPSVVRLTGPPIDQELADDFDIVGDIDRVVVSGGSGNGGVVRGAYVRFYAWQNGNPGALQDEQYVAAGDPALVFNAAQVGTVDVRLPHSFRATGKHFVSVQLAAEGIATWYWYSSRTGTPLGSPVRTRDNYASAPAWGAVDGGTGPINADAVMQLYGTATTPAGLASVAPQTVERSGWFTLTGTNFGVAQGASRVLVDKKNAIVVKWSPTEIVGYVPEAAALGAVEVVITNPLGTSNALTLNVAERKSVGRIRWQAKYFGDYMTFRPAVSPASSPDAGSVYAQVSGLIYAWTATGELKWVRRGGGAGQVTVSADGTVYVGDTEQPVVGQPYTVALTALDPRDGGVKWRVHDASNQIYAGPNVGPDGKVYVVFKPGQHNAAAFRPDGTVAWSRNNSLPATVSNGGVREIAFDAARGRLYFNAGSPSYCYDLAGAFVWSSGNAYADAPAIPPDGNLRLRNLNLSAANGSTNIYAFPLLNGPVGYPAAAGSDNTHYFIQSSYRLQAVKPDGTERWHYDDTLPSGGLGQVSDPNVSPSNSFVVMGGGGAFGQSGYFVAVDPATGQRAWRQALPTEQGFGEYGHIQPFGKFAFTTDGATAYTAGDILGDGDSSYQLTRYGYFYALNTTKENVVVNQPPKTTLVSPLPNSNVAQGTTLEASATVEDDGQVNRVEFFYNYNGTTNRIGVVTTPDASGRYTTQFVADRTGVYGVFAIAYDDGGLRGDSLISGVNVAAAYPTVRFVSPAPGAQFNAPSSITLKATASDRDGSISLVEFYNSVSGKIGETAAPDVEGNYTVVWNNPPAAGQIGLTAWATDNTGQRSSASVSVTVNAAPTPTPVPTATPAPTPTPAATPTPTPPLVSVSITSPTDGASVSVGTTVPVTAQVTDPQGLVKSVDFYTDAGASHLSTDFNAPYSTSIGASGVTFVELKAVARGVNGQALASSAVVVVNFVDPSGNLSLSGVIRHNQSAPGREIFLTNALVKLLQNDTRVIAQVRTDSVGRFNFTGLGRGGRYTLKPSEPGYTFFPPAVTWEGLAESATWDFTAAGPLPPGATPTPTPAPGSNSLTWEKFFDGPQHQADFDPRVAVDAQGNTVVAATSGSATTGDTDITTLKYSPAGELLWSAAYVGEGNYKDWASDVKTDAAGNVYVTGVSWEAAFPGSEYDIITIKYNAAGQRQWARVYNGPIGRWDMAYALALDSGGNVLVAGSSQSSTTERVYDEFVTVKYDAAGNELWARRHSTQQIGDDAYSLAVDSSNNVYVGGTGYASTGGVQTRDIITVKYNAAGAQQWASRFTGLPATEGPAPQPSNPVSNESGGIGLDPSGNVYVFGANKAGTTESDYLLLKYNPATGALVWSRNWSGASNDYPRDMAIDAAGSVYLTGESWDGAYQQATSENTWDAATVKFDGAGALQWARVYRGFPGKVDGGREIALDPAGNVYVGGFSEGFVNGDTFVAKYKPDGTEQWVYRYDNPEHTSDSLRDMASDSAGNLYLAGEAVLTNSAQAQTRDLVTLKLAASTAEFNAPPEVTIVVGPTIAGQPVAGSGDIDTGYDTNGPTIAGRSLKLEALASDRDGTVVSVSYYDGKTLIGTSNASPYTFQWNNAALGTRAVSATATDNSGATRTSATVTVTFADEPTPTPTPTPTPKPVPTPAPGPNPTSSPTNFALAANGGVATASSTTTQAELPGMDFSPSGVINGDRKGLNWEHGGGWRDATNNSYPDWVQIDFNGAKSISEVDVFSLQDGYSSPAEPTEATSFTQFGATAFDVLYWDGAAWTAVPGASVEGNNKVWRKLTFPTLTTTKVRVVVRNALAGRSRLVEVEAWGTTPTPAVRYNAALASNGGVATASSTTTQAEMPGMDFSPAGVINGDRKGLNWEHGGGWRDATNNSYPDWLQVEFATPTAVDEIDVFSLQDGYTSPAEPTEALTFTKYGVTVFEAQYWNGSGWVTVPGGIVANNGSVWRRLTFPAVTTTKIRVVVNNALAGRSRLVEVEAWGVAAAGRVNHAASSSGGAATASTTTSETEYPGLTFPVASVVNGDRKGLNWEHGGGWRDATNNSYPDWVQVDFAGARKVDEVSVFSLQDNYASPAEPTEALTFTKYGVTSFEVQYWDGSQWATVPGGVVTGNNLVWRRVTFPQVTTTKVRVVVNNALGGRSRIVEVEARGPAF